MVILLGVFNESLLPFLAVYRGPFLVLLDLTALPVSRISILILGRERGETLYSEVDDEELRVPRNKVNKATTTRTLSALNGIDLSASSSRKPTAETLIWVGSLTPAP